MEKGEEERFPLMQRETLVHRLILHSLLFTLLFLEDRSTEFHPLKTKKSDHWPFSLPSATLTSFHSYDGRERKDHHHARTRRARRLGFFAAEDTHQSSPTTSGSADGQARFFFFYALSSIWLNRNFNFILHLGGFQQGHSSVTSLSSWLLDVSWQKGRQISQWCDSYNVR